MRHTLVIPSELNQKLNAARANADTHTKWLAIGVNTVDDMLKKIKDRLNEKNPKLEIGEIRIEDKVIIKERIKNSGRASMFAGYFENEAGRIDALFFYVDPDAGNANDFLASKLPPVMIGIFKNHSDKIRDLHINTMPIYVVSLCTSGRVNNASVKQQIICAETMGINYIDVFNNRLYDVINTGPDDVITKINSLEQLDDLISQSGTNDFFQVDHTSKTLTITCVNMLQRTNDTAYIYRWFLRVVPAVYLASNEGYLINLSNIDTIENGDIPLIRSYIENFPTTI